MFNNSYMSQYFLYILAFAVVMLAQSRVQAAYHKYKRIPNEHGLTGEAVARRILDMNNLQSIRVEVAKGGMLSDHYDPVHHVVRLSPDIFYNASIASISVAAHEVGHAIQHKEHYGAIGLRNRLLPMANIASQLGWVVLVLGLFLFASTPVILYAGIAMICIILLFQIVTLPVEFNASSTGCEAACHVRHDQRTGALRRDGECFVQQPSPMSCSSALHSRTNLTYPAYGTGKKR